ncbi:MAG: hypothetical protein IPH86_07575 [bacterium]|nr:hypothetical protein [bacterium]
MSLRAARDRGEQLDDAHRGPAEITDAEAPVRVHRQQLLERGALAVGVVGQAADGVQAHELRRPLAGPDRAGDGGAVHERELLDGLPRHQHIVGRGLERLGRVAQESVPLLGEVQDAGSGVGHADPFQA